MNSHARRLFASSLTALCVSLLPCVSALAENGSLLHRGDKLTVTVFNHPELSVAPTNPLVVGSDGTVSVPGVGLVPAAGATLAAVSTRVTNGLAKFLRRPVVDVQLVGEGGSLFVSGGPGGVLVYAPGETLMAALGQLTIGLGVNLRAVGVVRNGTELGTYDIPRLRVAGETGPALMPGDEIQLPGKPITVSVSGAVTTPAIAYLDRNEPLSSALSQAGTPTPDANTGDVILIRDGVRNSYALGSPTLSAPGQAGDQLIVQRAPRVDVTGMVEHSGQAVLRTDQTLLAALYQLGGPNRFGDVRHVIVTHEGARETYDITRLTHGDLSQNPKLADGDIVFVPEGRKVDFRGIFQTVLYGAGAAHQVSP
jgi:protein involved in polysaccharide export with SLBB domain